jgi:serine/threonine protein kinase
VTASIGEERRRYGEYDIESLLGKGSIGKVYLARHRRIGRRVALKTIHLEQRFEDDVDESEFYRRLQREAEVCGALQHPNIVTLYDVGYENDIVSYLATEYVDGESLLARVKRSRPLPVAEALSISRDLLRGLSYAHGKGVIHRDIKPANILLTSGGEAKLADFGIARPLNSSLTGTNSLLGTPSYMSPEQVRSAPVTPRSDLFSVGVVMYEMLTGVKPFASPQLSGILFKVVNHEPPPANEVNGGVPVTIARLVEKLMSKEAADRGESAAEALQELELFESPAPVTMEMEYSTLGPGAASDAGEHTIGSVSDTTTHFPSLREVEVVPSTDPFSAMALSLYSKPARLRRRIPPLAFWAVTLLLAAALLAAVAYLRGSIRGQQPAIVHSKQQLDEFALKRRSLNEARELAQSGKLPEALTRYDGYLARYPGSTAAQRERTAVKEELDRRSAPVVERAARTGGKVSPAEPPPQPVPVPPPSRWDRVKRWFRGK